MNTTQSAFKIKTLASLIPQSKAVAEKKALSAKQNGGIAGIPCYIASLNKALGGYQQGLHIIAGSPGEGKTSFLLQIAIHSAKKGNPVIFLTFEALSDILTIRSVCLEENLIYKSYLDGLGDLDKYATLANNLQNEEWISNLIILEGDTKTTIKDFSQFCKEIQQQFNKPVLIIVDYLQRWARFKKDSAEMRHNVSILSSELSELSKIIESPVIAVSSQNRSGQGGKEMISLKESGDLEFDADSITFLIKDTTPNNDKINRRVKLVISKNRYGELCDIPLLFKADIGTLAEVSNRY